MPTLAASKGQAIIADDSLATSLSKQSQNTPGVRVQVISMRQASAEHVCLCILIGLS